MTPSADARIRSIINGLQDVIFPAVDQRESLATEQTGMVIAQLEMLIKQIPALHKYQTLCNDDMRGTANAIVEGCAGGSATRAACAALNSALTSKNDDLHEDYNRIGAAVEGVMTAMLEDAEPAWRERGEKLMLALACRQIWRERVWCRDSGFDAYPDELCEIDDMVSGRVLPPQ
jgi:hypothetical protein